MEYNIPQEVEEVRDYHTELIEKMFYSFIEK